MGRKRAVVVGVNDYSVQGIGNLSWCVNDARAVAQVLRNSFAFDDIYLYTDARATSSNIRRALRYILNEGEAGDVACFYYAGHGGYLADPNNAGRAYETIIPYSGRWITDHDFYVEAERLEHSAVNFTTILDSCHSGGMNNATDEAMSLRTITRTGAWWEDFLANLKTVVPIGIVAYPGAIDILRDNVVNAGMAPDGQIDLDLDPNRFLVEHTKATMIAACNTVELAQEHSSLRHGLFTQAILDVCNQSNQSISYDQLMTDLQAAMNTRIQALGLDAQNPQLRGQQNRMEEDFLLGWIDCR